MDLTSGSKILIQGLAEPLAQYQVPRMQAYGMQIVAGVSPGWEEKESNGITNFDLVEQALKENKEIEASVIFVPPYEVLDAALEAIAAGIRQLIIVTGRVPPLDVIHLAKKAEVTGTVLLGPGSLGMLIPEKICLGNMEPQFYKPGKLGLLSRTDSLTHQVAWQLTQAGLGQSIVISLGREGVVASGWEQWLDVLEGDQNTEVILLVAQASSWAKDAPRISYLKNKLKKSVIIYLVGNYPTWEQRLGEDISLLSQPVGESQKPPLGKSKLESLRKAKIQVTHNLDEVVKLAKKALK